MNTAELWSLLNHKFANQGYFIFVGGCDEQVNIPHRTPATIIFNTEPKDLPGRHWVAVFIDTDHFNAWYYDPTGQPISGLLHWNVSRVISGKVNIVNQDIHQPNYSTFCGLYCVTWLDFLVKLQRNPDFFVSENHLEKNDLLVLFYLWSDLETLYK